MSTEYYAAYRGVLEKFARAPEQGIQSFVKAAHDQPVHHTNSHDAVLADYLEEHDDPRHLIVRRHLDATKHPDGYSPYRNDERQMIPHVGFPVKGLDSNREHDTPEANTTFWEYHNPDSGQKVWMANMMVPYQIGQSAHNRFYRAALTPAEVEHIFEHTPGHDASGGLHAPLSYEDEHEQQLPALATLPVDLS